MSGVEGQRPVIPKLPALGPAQVVALPARGG